MLSLARALGRAPKVLLADELSLGLAPIIVTNLLKAVRAAADERGVGVLLVEQHVRQALKVADRVYLMERGRVVLSGTSNEVLRPDRQDRSGLPRRRSVSDGDRVRRGFSRSCPASPRPWTPSARAGPVPRPPCAPASGLRRRRCRRLRSARATAAATAGRGAGSTPNPTTSSAWLTAVTARTTISSSISVTMARVWFPPSATSRSWNVVFATANASGSSIDASSLSINRFSSATAVTPAALRRDRLGHERLDQRARFEHVGERHVARAQHQRRGPRRHALVRLVHDDSAVHAADDGDQTVGLEDAQRFAQRRTRNPEPFDELWLAPDRLPFGQLTADDQRAQLVRDLLRLLAETGPVALAGCHLNRPASQGRIIWRLPTPPRTSRPERPK